MKEPAGMPADRAMADTDSGHTFSASGTAPFLRCIRDTSLEWEADTPVGVKAGSGMSEASGSLKVLPEGKYQISPYESTRLTAKFSGPVYFLTTQKIYDILCTRYVLDIKLYSRWRLNFWPLMLDYFLRTGKWASTIEEMREFGAMIVADMRKNATPELKKLSKLKRLRRQFPIVMMTRFNVDSTLRKWSKKNWANIYRKFFNSPHFDEMADNAELLKTIREKGSDLVAFKSVIEEDDLAFTMPFELAVADSLQSETVVGLAKIDGTSGGSARSEVVSSLRLDSALLDPITLPCTLSGGRVHLPLVSGAKKAYDATMQAPIIIKGKDVSATLYQNQPRTGERVKSRALDLIDPDRNKAPSENPSDLKIEIIGSEA